MLSTEAQGVPRVSFGNHASRISRDILWSCTSQPGLQFDKYSGKATTDVAVIGGGVAGLSTALHLAEAGVSVTVLEADVPGHGASGRSGGLIAPELIRQTPLEVEHMLRDGAGTRMVQLIGSSAKFCFDLIGKHGLICESNQGGFWVPAHDPNCAERLRNRANEWLDRGFKVRYTEREETAEWLGADRYCGALVFADGGTINPLAFCRELALTALKHGAAVHAHSRVITLTRTADLWTLRTEQGELKARRIVLAANGGNANLHPQMRKTVLPLDVIEYATAPLSADQQNKILRDQVSFTDKQPYIFTARYDAERRLISAFPDFPVRRSEASLRREAITRIKQHFPALKGFEIQFLWPGRAWLNSDLLPKIYTLGQDAYAIQACNGRGLAINTALGANLAEAFVRNDFSNLPVRLEAPKPIPAYSFARYTPALLMFIAHALNKLGRLWPQ